MSSKIHVNNFKAGGPEIVFEKPELDNAEKNSFANSGELDIPCTKCGKKFAFKPGRNVCPHCGQEQTVIFS